jgi:bifunctional oligoribonuclease and PAP phosphatase NrnA
MKQIIDQLIKSKQVLVVSHVHPDGDAIGSMLSLGSALESLKKKVHLYNQSTLPAVYQFLPSIHRIKRDPGEIATYDTAVILDCSDLQRIGDAAEAVSHIPTVINIDHHITNSRFGNYQLVDANASSSAEIMYRLIVELGLPFNMTMAYAIYTGIMADTGSFRFSNTTPEAFRISHEMVAAGADPHTVAHHVYETISLSRIKLLTMLFDTIELSECGGFSIMTLTQEMLIASGTEIADVNGLINYAKRIENVKVAALLYERRNGKKEGQPGSNYHVSLRSDGSVNVSNIAAIFGGGGHISAAGFDVYSTLPELKKKLFSLSPGLG